MSSVDLITILVILLVVGGILLYLYRAKKRGEVCIGCPHGRQCAGKHPQGGCGHHAGETGQQS